MNNPVVRFPVTCPECGAEALSAFPIDAVAAALIDRSPIKLRASCHSVSWTATPIELEQIREYLGAPWASQQSDSLMG
jgi:hypothetical protein